MCQNSVLMLSCGVLLGGSTLYAILTHMQNTKERLTAKI